MISSFAIWRRSVSPAPIQGKGHDCRLDHVRPEVAGWKRDRCDGVLIGPLRSVADRANVWERLWERSEEPQEKRFIFNM